MNFADRNYIIVTDYIQPDGTSDVSAAIQALIDANPNRTIFFPDGEYLLSKPICTPANPVNAVSLKLATFAKLKAMDSWTEKEAVVRLGDSHASREFPRRYCQRASLGNRGERSYPVKEKPPGGVQSQSGGFLFWTKQILAVRARLLPCRLCKRCEDPCRWRWCMLQDPHTIFRQSDAAGFRFLYSDCDPG